MRAAVTERVGVDVGASTGPSRASRAPARCSSAPRRSASAARTTTSSPASCPMPPAARSSRACSGHEVGATIAAVGPGLPRRAELRPAGGDVPISACGALLPVQRRAPERLRQLRADRASTPTAGCRSCCASRRSRCSPSRPPTARWRRWPSRSRSRSTPCAAGAIQAGERVVVLGAGPIGQCVAVVARELGAEVLLVDLQESRLELGRALGAETLRWTTAAEVVAAGARVGRRRRPAGRRRRHRRAGGGARDGRHGRLGRAARSRWGCPTTRRRSASAA